MHAPAKAPLWLRVSAGIVWRLPAARYLAAAWLARRAPDSFQARLPRRLGGSWFNCEPWDVIAAQAYFVGVYEPQETALVQRALYPGATFVDVGANWGYFTLLAASQVGPAGKVIAVEPHPRLCSMLRNNVELNGYRNVSVLELAAAERGGRVPLLLSDPATGNSGLSYLAPTAGARSGSIIVTTGTLDDVFANLGVGGITLLKMDIEGGEARALAGLSRSLKAGIIDQLLLEIHPRHLCDIGSSPQEVFRLLVENGFRGWVVDHSPKANRRAAYARRLAPSEYLRPFRRGLELDGWPHFLWTREE